MCGLVDAITSANSNTPIGGCIAGDVNETDTIVLQHLKTYSLSIAAENHSDGYNGLPSITSYIKIVGCNSSIVRVSASPKFRIFHIANSGNLILEGITLEGGDNNPWTWPPYKAPPYSGGSIFNRGTVVLNSCTITQSSSIAGGGLYNESGTSILNDSIIKHNSAVLGGGGIFVENGSATISHSKISFNRSYDYGGGINNQYGTIELSYVTLMDNTAWGSDMFNKNTGGGWVQTHFVAH